jgi:hypothetical protein
MTIWSILGPLQIFYGHLVYLCCGNLVYFPRFGILDQEKSGKPVPHIFVPVPVGTHVLKENVGFSGGVAQ